MKNRTIILFASVLVLALSCNRIVTYKTDLPDRFTNSGAPSITGIFDIQDGAMENPLESGSLAQIIHIKGNNLAHPVKVSFNGIEADLSQCYFENKDGYVVIPRVLPSTVDNKMVYVTPEGTVSYDFEVGIPELVVTGLRNEYALAGSTVQLLGNYFDLFGFGVEGSDASVSLGETPLELLSVAEDALEFVIPEGTPDNSLITVSWTDVKLGPQSKKIPYRNTSYLFFKNFDTTGFWDANLAATILTDGTADGDPASLGYRFFRFKGSYGAWTWNSLGMGDGWYYTTPEDEKTPEDETDWKQDYLFKFELWTNPSLPIPAYNVQDGPRGLFVQLNLAANVALDFEGAAVNTGGEWITYAFPLTSVATTMPKNGDYWGFAMTVQPPVDWTLDFAIANIRMEPANY